MTKFKGKVIKGKGKGKEFGFPTANIKLEEKAESGVYYGWTIIDQKKYRSAIFIPDSAEYLETHLLDFEEDLYDKEIEVEVAGKLRESMVFQSAEGLIKQVLMDIKAINQIRF